MIDRSNWNPVNLARLTGILEGEGSFAYTSNQIRVQCEMTDEDIVIRVRFIAGFGGFHHRQPNQLKANGDKRKPTWSWTGKGEDAFNLEFELFPMMGVRRQEKITETWKQRMDYELSTSRGGLNRIFASNSGELLPNSRRILL